MRPVYASDIYAVGVTCLYLLLGKSPRDLEYNPSTGEILWQHQVQISDHLEGVIKKMLEVSVRHRYQSADEVLRAIELEPYLQTLAKGLATKPSEQIPNITSEDDGYRPYVVEMAEAIRARRAKTTGNAQPGKTSHQAQTVKQTKSTTTRTPIATEKKPKVIQKLDTNSLLAAYVNGKRDFALQDLSLLDLKRANLANTNLHSCKLDRANLQGANLFDSDLSRASLNQANLKQSNLCKAYLSHANLEGADFRGADLSHAYLMNANL